MDELSKLTQTLPQELIDTILTFTITLSNRHHTGISSGYTPPSALHINRHTRDAFASEYYANTIFHSSSEKLLAKWLKSLPSEHLNLLQKVRLVVRRPSKQDRHRESNTCDCYRAAVKNRLLCAGVEVEDMSFLTIWT